MKEYDRVGCEIIKQGPDADRATVVFDGLAAARSRKRLEDLRPFEPDVFARAISGGDGESAGAAG